MKLVPLFALGLAVLTPLFCQESDPRFRLTLGDPRFKDQTVDVAPGQIISMESGKPIPFETMFREMQAVPFVYVGEDHESLPMHELQVRIIQALFEQDRRLAVALEMVPAIRQDVLTQWSLGLLTEDEFLRKSTWYTSWGFNFGFYRSIFAFSKDRKIPLLALDAPREVVAQFRMRDGEILAGEVKTVVPKPDPSEEEGRLLLRKSLESSDLPGAIKGAVLETMFEDLYRAQSARDADMAALAVQVQKQAAGKVAVLIASGHIIYGHGFSGIVRETSGLPSKSVVPVSIPKNRSSITVSRTLADYIVGITAAERPAYPAIGLAFKTSPISSKPMIARKPANGAARGLDFEENDIVLSVDDRAFSDVEELQIYLARIPWGGEARFRLLRQGVEKTVVLAFSR